MLTCFRDPNPPGTYSYGLTWRKATAEDYNCNSLRGDQQEKRCELWEHVAGVWNELLPRLQHLAVSQTSQQTDASSQNTMLGSGNSLLLELVIG